MKHLVYFTNEETKDLPMTVEYYTINGEFIYLFEFFDDTNYLVYPKDRIRKIESVPEITPKRI